MSNKFFLTALCLSIMVIAESIWSANYLSAAGKIQIKTPLAIIPTPQATLSLESQNTTAKIGEDFETSIVVDPGVRPFQAVDANIFFDKDKLQVKEIIPTVTEEGAQYPQNTFDNVKGRLGVSLLLFNQPLAGKTAIAKVIFTPIAQGEATVNFDFLLGGKNDSNVVLYKEAVDSLGKVANLTLTVLP